MKRKIIVPVDFSPCSLHAARYALSLARIYHADMELFNICHPHPEAAVSGTGNWPYDEDSCQQGQALYMLESLALLLSHSLEQPGPLEECLPQVTFFSAKGNLLEETMSRMASGEFDMAIVGLSRRNGFFSVKLGLNLLTMIRGSTIPIICIPECYTFRTPKKLAFATDLDPCDIPILSTFLSFSRAIHADILLLHANLGKAEQSRPLDFNGFLKQASSKMEFYRISQRSIISRQLTPALKYAIDHGDLDILAMTCHKKKGIRRWLSRNHIKPLLRSTRIPLLLYHAKQDNRGSLM